MSTHSEQDTQFSVSAWADAHTTLTDGHPQTSTTTEVTLCTSRNPDTGACEEPQSAWYTRQAAFFSFNVILTGDG